MPSASEDYYEILQIHPKAEPEIIRAAYRRLVQKYHPDKNPDYSAEQDECMKKISMAYSVLKDPVKRAAYDKKAGYVGNSNGSAGTSAGKDQDGKASGSAASSGTGPTHAGRDSASTANKGGTNSTRKRNAASGLEGEGGPKRRANWIIDKGGYPHAGYKTGPGKVNIGDISSAPNIHGWNAERVHARQKATAAGFGSPVFFRHRLKSGGEGPVMAWLPSGSFLMGSEGGLWGFGGEKERESSEGPQHRVILAKPFAIGRFAVSFAEYDLFCEALGRAKPRDEGWGRGNRPVINVSWHDAQAYCQWLTGQTGKNYRLPSEAEWEYACRAGTAPPFWWSSEISPQRANYNGHHAYNRGDRGRFLGRTVAVDEYKPNPFGLYQTSGNVWEWCEDDWHKNYKGAPTDGTAWVDSENRGKTRVARGGSWASVPSWLRSAARSSGEAEGRFDDQGFRLVQS